MALPDYQLSNDAGKVTVYLLHGIYGAKEYWRPTIGRLIEHGYRVVAWEAPGYGQSALPAQLSFDLVAEAGARLIRATGSERNVVFGHSMGGLIAIRGVQMGCVDPAALVLTSPLLGLKLRVNPIKRLLGQLLVRFIPTARFRNGLDPRNMTRDARFAEERRNDPLIVRTVTASWFFAMQRCIQEGLRDADRIQVPILAFRGMQDETTDGDILAEWLSKTNSRSSELVSLPMHVHEVFHESDWTESMDRMIQWLEQVEVIRSSSGNGPKLADSV